VAHEAGDGTENFSGRLEVDLQELKLLSIRSFARLKVYISLIANCDRLGVTSERLFYAET
jgi:hypothetical protein